MFQSPSNRVNIPNRQAAAALLGCAVKEFQSPSNRVNIPNV